MTGLLPEIPGASIIDGGFLNSTTAIAVPNGKPEALAYVSQFIEEAKSGGLVRKALDDIGLKTSEVAPAGLKPYLGRLCCVKTDLRGAIPPPRYGRAAH